MNFETRILYINGYFILSQNRVFFAKMYTKNIFFFFFFYSHWLNWSNTDESSINHFEWLLSQHSLMFLRTPREIICTRCSTQDSKFHFITMLSALPVSCHYLFLMHPLYLPVRSSRNFGWTEKSRHDFATVLMTVEWRRWWILIRRSPSS